MNRYMSGENWVKLRIYSNITFKRTYCHLQLKRKILESIGGVRKEVQPRQPNELVLLGKDTQRRGKTCMPPSI